MLGDLALQFTNPMLQLGYQSQQLLPAQGGHVFWGRHGWQCNPFWWPSQPQALFKNQSQNSLPENP
jgi:hypothetical protein